MSRLLVAPALRPFRAVILTALLHYLGSDQSCGRLGCQRAGEAAPPLHDAPHLAGSDVADNTLVPRTTNTEQAPRRCGISGQGPVVKDARLSAVGLGTRPQRGDRIGPEGAEGVGDSGAAPPFAELGVATRYTASVHPSPCGRAAITLSSGRRRGSSEGGIGPTSSPRGEIGECCPSPNRGVVPAPPTSAQGASTGFGRAPPGAEAQTRQTLGIVHVEGRIRQDQSVLVIVCSLRFGLGLGMGLRLRLLRLRLRLLLRLLPLLPLARRPGRRFARRQRWLPPAFGPAAASPARGFATKEHPEVA
mmetsp:Transcript_313/g.881  ORF Transcript_313/g.881 Transcript_313/m.881 type:complete len:304 (-) Transcript_313:1754-2665(-)